MESSARKQSVDKQKVFEGLRDLVSDQLKVCQCNLHIEGHAAYVRGTEIRRSPVYHREADGLKLSDDD